MELNTSTYDSSTGPSLDLSSLPALFVSKTHLDQDHLHDLEDRIIEVGGNLTYDVTEAKIILSKAERKRRIELDLRSSGLFTEQVLPSQEHERSREDPGHALAITSAKRRKTSHPIATDKYVSNPSVVNEEDSTASESEDGGPAKQHSISIDTSTLSLRSSKLSPSISDSLGIAFSCDTVKVLSVQWFEDCFKARKLLSTKNYITYEGRVIERPSNLSAPPEMGGARTALLTVTPVIPYQIPDRAKVDAAAQDDLSHGYGTRSKKRSVNDGLSDTNYSYNHASGTEKNKHAHLLHETTSEHEENVSSDIPEMPDWVKDGIRYSCQRKTPSDPPNKEFISELKKIKLARLLTNDQIGVRAYSTSIASIAAYPYKISNPREVLHLPGCDAKVTNLYVEYVNTGHIKEAEDAENNDELKVLRLFYDIWGVGAIKAREFYHDQGWRDLDDIVEHGWSTLSRVQQIGVKYYSEFQCPIPRKEVEDIAAIVTRHAVKVKDSRVQTLVVGGYRRGKDDCGDVDILISHPDDEQTLHFINDIVSSLEDEDWITHTLQLSLASSSREQRTLPLRTGGAGGGFDTLDKALVVWQDPQWPTKETDLAANPKFKNPNIHRRVDIIVSPWRTVGCAVMGWSGGTTFQRDLRRYTKHMKGWKFDSSGIRDYSSGKVVDIEGYDNVKGRADTMEDAERRAFEGLGLEYQEPRERCTG